ncbi:MAG: hypothetical protein SCH71_16705, partial [Desulfobulbaceae bacterium]|nr:hypothetical protein [Desulfobulbaceae bacterium]
ANGKYNKVAPSRGDQGRALWAQIFTIRIPVPKKSLFIAMPGESGTPAYSRNQKGQGMLR